MSHIFDRFSAVPASRRPIPFWSWNDKLDPEELRRQVREMADAGMGGYFMHARGGLETEYLGDQWMDCVAAATEEGSSLGMNPWLYDEEGWPSGFAGGRVPERGSETYGRWLVYQELDGSVPLAKGAESANGELLALYRVARDGTYGRLSKDQVPASVGDDQLVALFQVSTPYYVDVLDKDAIAAFMQETHQRYSTRLPAAFPKTKGFFTDEPRFSGSIDRDPPWSLKMSEHFKDQYGYDILDHLVALFFPVRGYQKIRYHYYALASHLFVENFTKQIGDWCRSHGCGLTGHLMMEESVFVQAANTAGVMPHYEHMDMPGVDWLRRPIGSPVVPKQVGSVAAQLGKDRVITESFALSGWDVSFEELKRIVEWQYVNGVNMLCQHLEGYSLRGFRKRDYPPSLFFQQAWWLEYRNFNDYVGRLGMVLSEGVQAPRALVLHPMRSGWVLFDGTSYTDEFRSLDRDFVDMCEALSGAHVEYHLGDETIMESHGSVVSSIEGPLLKVGLCSYEAVVLPSLRCVSSSTLSLLEAFVAQGGLVIAGGDLPSLVDGEVSERLVSFLSSISVAEGPGFAAALLRQRLGGLPSLAPWGASLLDGALDDGELSSIHLTERRFQGKDAGESCRAYFLVNLDQQKAYETRLRLPGEGRLRRYRVEDGSFEDCHSVTHDGITEAILSFEPMRSMVLLLDDGDSAGDLGIEAPTLKVDASGTWDIESMDLNSLTLDSCAYRIDGGPLQDEKPVIHLMQELLELRRPADIELHFSFLSELDSSDMGAKDGATSGTCFFALERAKEFSIQVNGSPVPYVDAGWWKDSSFLKVDIQPYLKKGRNQIILKRRFYQREKVYEVLFGKDVYETEKNKLTYDVELESIYLVGDFAVKSDSPFVPGERNSLYSEGPFTLIPPPTRVSGGDLTTAGFPFFSGSVVLSREIQIAGEDSGRPIKVSINKPRAVAAALSVDGVRVGFLPWSPWSVMLPRGLEAGAHRLSITLWSGNRNLLGPHHHSAGEPYNVGPDSFTGRWSWVEKATEAEPADAEVRTRSYWKDGYAFVSFGLRP